MASGDPEPDGVVLWTRLAPDPLNGGGMGPRPVAVRWEVAEDERLRRVVARGEAIARAEVGHTVHVEVDGLRPGRWYWYRFVAGGEASATGRTRTAPAPGSDAAVRFAFASCQHYEHGYYTAYRHMADEDLDLVLHLGDYIYESPRATRPPAGGPGLRRRPSRRPWRLPPPLRPHKLDPDLQAAHPAFPWVVTWDDHEVQNNYAGLTCGTQRPRRLPRPPGRRLPGLLRAHAAAPPLAGPAATRCASTAGWTTASCDFNVLDTRQYRTDQAPAGTTGWRRAGARRSGPPRSTGWWTASPGRTRAGTWWPSRSSSPGVTAHPARRGRAARRVDRLPGGAPRG